ncbi:ATP-dependent RNA helicase TDRD9-like [Anoplophora glabripennis]|uniref:ATP-dependent RNA helicase TDRD9-like n=1 Tax=Anoplophora glabripennis TaxID=217634 RepID=UPI00087501E7|nr:ATP-dependent RNA helicase TDRD9-like [Anoplophora glabripennis]
MSLLVPGKIPYEVYEALRKRQLSFMYEPSSADVVCGAGDKNVFQEPTASLPSNGGKRYSKSRSSSSPAENYITLQISEFIDAAHFWAHTQKSMSYLSVIIDILNGDELCPITTSENLPENIELNLDQFYATRYNKDNLFYRCKVIAYENDWALVIFIDYGNTQQVTLQEIYYLPHIFECNLPPLSMECILQGIRPSPKCNPAGIWSERISNICKRQINGVLLYGKIHSVVEDVVYLEVYIKKPRGRNAKSVNDFLIEKGYAEPTEEYENMKMFVEATVDLGELDIAENYIGSSLRGPFSPLEIKFHGCTKSFHNKIVNLDSNSVNTILLNNEPESCQTRMLAAAIVTGVECNGLKLNQTTLLPNIPGLPMIVTLMFCPQMTLKLNQDGTKVVAILCGFGCCEATAQSSYPVSDLTLALDTVLAEVEIKKINKIRFHMNEAMTFMRDISEELATDHEIIRIQNCIKTELKELVNMQRLVTSRDVWSENQIAVEILEPDLCGDPEDIWPLLQFVRLNKSQDLSGNIAKNLDDLDRAARGDESTEGLECKLCQNPLGTRREVNRHLKSELHQKNVTEYYEKKFQL